MSKIVCVIPAYNEEKHIAEVVRGIPAFVDDIIVVNDGSRDGTHQSVSQLGDRRVILIDHETNLGVGAAMSTGYRNALELGADIVVKIDGDGQMDGSELARLISPIEEGRADYCKGVRFRDKEVLRTMPRSRLIGNLGLTFLTKAASGYWNIADPTNGFTAIGGAALKRLRLESLSRGFFFETDVLVNLNMIDAVVADVPMPTRYGDEESSLNPIKVFFTFPFHLIKALCKRILWNYFIRDFTAFSAFLVSGSILFWFGLLYGVYQWTSHWITQTATPTGTIMLATVPFILGFQLLLQAIVLDIGGVPSIPLQGGETLRSKIATPPSDKEFEISGSKHRI